MQPYYKDNVGFEPPGYGAMLDRQYREYKLGLKDPRKENNMNEQVQNVQAEPVLVDEQLPEFLKQAAEKLEKDGEVLIQTEEDVGTEQPVKAPATVH